MARDKKEKIQVNPIQSGFNTPFSDLLGNVQPSADPLPPTTSVSAPKPKKGRVVLRKETAHRGGKTVIIVHDFEPRISLAEIESLAKHLRKACGCGGTVKNREIEIQGEHAPKIRQLLQVEGFQVAGI